MFGFLSPRKGVPLLLIPEYSGMNKGQRVPDRSKTAHRKPLVKCFLTIKPVHPKGNQSWIFIGRTDAQAEALIIWPPDGKKWLTGKDPDAGKDWRPEEKGTTENEMDGWNHYLHGHDLEQAPWVSGGQRSLGCCSPWGHKQLDTMSEWSDDI